MNISGIRISHQYLPLKKVFRTAMRTATEIQQVSVELISSNGLVGQSAVGATTKVTGETISSITTSIQDYIFPQIKDTSIENLETILVQIQKSLPFNYSAKAAVDMAVYDLYCKCTNQEIYQYLGVHRKELKSSMTIGIDSLDNMSLEAEKAVASGFSCLKIKVGKNHKEDIAVIDAICERVGTDVGLRLDANQGWSRKDALLTIEKMQKYPNIEVIEQPLPAYDIKGMKWLKERIAIPLMADESVFEIYEAERVIDMQAVDLINLKLLKCGGIFPTLRIAKIAQEANIECMLGCMMEGSKSLIFSIYFACSQKNITKVDLDSLYFLRSFELPESIHYANGNVVLEIN